MGTTDRAGARNVLSSSVPWGSFQSVKCRDAFWTREATHHEGRDPPVSALPFPSLRILSPPLGFMLPFLTTPCSPHPSSQQDGSAFSPPDLLSFGIKHV